MVQEMQIEGIGLEEAVKQLQWEARRLNDTVIQLQSELGNKVDKSEVVNSINVSLEDLKISSDRVGYDFECRRCGYEN